MHYTVFFSSVNNDKFPLKNVDIFPIFAQNINCGYTLKPPCRGGSNEYPLSMFWIKHMKNWYTSAYFSYTIRKWGIRVYSLDGHLMSLEYVEKYVYPLKPHFYLIKVGFKGVYITWTCFPDVIVLSSLKGPRH